MEYLSNLAKKLNFDDIQDLFSAVLELVFRLSNSIQSDEYSYKENFLLDNVPT